MNLRSIIVDDEYSGRYNLQCLIKDFCENIEVIGSATTVSEAARIIQKKEPDLVFLDIALSGESGFTLFDYLQKDRAPVIIFVTAYEEYALKAFRFSAVDYLLKPINLNHLHQAIQRAQERIIKKQKAGNKHVRPVLEQKVDRLALPHQEGYRFLDFHEIVSIVANRNYTEINLIGGKKILLAKTLGQYEDLLPSSQFFRSHRSFIINIQHILEYIKKDGGYILMRNGQQVRLANNRKDQFFNLFAGH